MAQPSRRGHSGMHHACGCFTWDHCEHIPRCQRLVNHGRRFTGRHRARTDRGSACHHGGKRQPGFRLPTPQHFAIITHHQNLPSSVRQHLSRPAGKCSQTHLTRGASRHIKGACLRTNGGEVHHRIICGFFLADVGLLSISTHFMQSCKNCYLFLGRRLHRGNLAHAREDSRISRTLANRTQLVTDSTQRQRGSRVRN